MNVDITEIKECEKILRTQINKNLDLAETDFMHHLCLSINELQWMIRMLEKGQIPKKLEDIPD